MSIGEIWLRNKKRGLLGSQLILYNSFRTLTLFLYPKTLVCRRIKYFSILLFTEFSE